LARWFDTNYDICFMLQAYHVNVAPHTCVSTLIHINFSHGLNLVTHDSNNRGHDVIKALGDLVGVPAVPQRQARPGRSRRLPSSTTGAWLPQDGDGRAGVGGRRMITRGDEGKS